jgi:DNA-binding CsgD family transcriptional regulator
MSITKREKEILYYASFGYSRKQIADKVYLSTHTVNDYMKSLLYKMDATNVAELIRLGFEEGLRQVRSQAISQVVYPS